MIFRVEKNKDYTVMSNYHLREKEMSLKAKGLLSWMLSNNDDWDYSISGIVANCKENETAIKTALNELQEFGYLEVKKLVPDKDNPTIHYEYIIHEKSVKSTNNQDIDFLGVENLALENQAQRNTNISNTKKVNNTVINKLITTDVIVDDNITKKRKKDRYEQYEDIIIHYTNNVVLQERLRDYIPIRVDLATRKGKQFYPNVFKGLLNELDRLTDNTQTAIEIVEQSIKNEWENFYSIKKYNNYSKKSVKSDPTERNVVTNKKSDAELDLADEVY